MTATSYEIRLCPNCGLRYPLIENHPFGTRCPNCLGTTEIVLERKLHTNTPFLKGEGTGVRAVLLDNIRSAWNVGAIFRTADGLGLRKLYLCGITPTPENKSVRKTSLGAEKSIAWEYSPNALDTLKRLKTEGRRLIALEQDSRAIPLHEYQNPISDSQVPLLVLGNEVTGVDPEILDLCDQIIQIPMLGQKRSFNVEVAFGIAAFQLANLRVRD